MKTFALPRAMDFMSDGGSIAPPPTHPTKVVKVMIELQDVDMTTGIEQPSGTQIEQPINNTSQEQPSGNVSQKASKRPRQMSFTWDDDTTRALIRIYDEQWNHINKGNFRLKDWEAVVLNLNAEMDTTYNTENAKNRIDTLKKMYKKEKLKSSSTGASPSTWSFFDILDVMWCKTPRCIGLAGGLDNDGPAKENEDILNELEQEVGTNSGVSASTTQNPISSMDFTELEGVSGSRDAQSISWILKHPKFRLHKDGKFAYILATTVLCYMHARSKTLAAPSSSIRESQDTLAVNVVLPCSS
ncbi:hypothetical protein GOP47_0028039 [Adiantum capillus-veneris]|nr:hypothetical protein GOP47_0028039 [Adiantum capillus-veneris]